MARKSERPPKSPPRPNRWEGKEKPDWLSRALARAGAMPQDEAEAAIKAGRVTVNGRVATTPLTPVPPDAVIKVDGMPVRKGTPTHVLAFHKPAGVLTSTARQHRTGTVFELLLPQLPLELNRFTWHAVGRLDVDTTGLLLFTNDDKLVAHATSPETNLPKRYVATVFSTADDAKVEPLRQGMMLDDGPARPAKVRVRDEHTVEVTLTEGRHHQVKRMLGAVGLPARALHREAVGDITLDDIPEGGFRLLTEEEVREKLNYSGRD
ncbi:MULTISPECIES: pseudouridine synthase [unclassified Corallococcus]|uniref:pseudouridine synthase n=1 Tax=unclassified Corallococcus TaxID=2685029 RepID=UPI001A8DCE16|nr:MULTISPECIES: pseudouridine synthase [unclassified Corallococcus]MBN9683744.1 rRNA pseudouridine synthase [Corallococcus sp. NCSPR001]WAS84751.1 pseudouridine synthase [Corallococcus sp. NCRR]